VTVLDIKANRLDGAPGSLGELAARAVLVVNVASECGFTPQYAGLQALYERYRDRGLVVAGFPCNQFGAQEPGTAEEIGEFCSVNYGVTFPMFAKVEVNGPERHPLFAELTKAADARGRAGDVRWNFEKFLVTGDGQVLARFRTGTEPEAPEVIGAIEASLAGPGG
jgi:glutathione peroxidase